MQNLDKSKVAFKDYNFNQNLLLPPSLEELIDPNHPVRVVNQVVDNLSLDPILSKYEGGGCPAYHPRLMLKALVYGYVTNLYSSRKIEQALQQNIHFMWLSGMSYPDHNTINRFRSERLKGVFKEVFSQVVLLLIDHGHITLKEAYLDGTKIEANANRYTFVWGRTIKYNRGRIKNQLKELWSYAEQVAKEELEHNEPESFEKLDAEKVGQAIEQIDKALAGKEVDKKVKQKLNYARKRWPEALDKYEDYERQLGDRNSLSRTDPDATFMRMKEDHMLNGQLKPGYNWQITTQDQYILGYTLHQTTNDTATLAPHIESLKESLGQLPESLVADAGYGSEENYEYLENKGIDAYVKFNNFHKEQTKKWKENPHRVENLYYNKELDCYYCPMGQPMTFVKNRTQKSGLGYKQFYRQYQAQNCEGCPMRGPCHKGKDNRKIDANTQLNQYKQEIREKLNSERGQHYRSRRPVDVEAVFGNVKYNHGFKRFLLRGMEKVEIEVGLISLAQNLRKMAN
ncbi:MAG: IS1182 family transposase [Deltaproteobacteria bacterium]|nr:IS1182 family transposase [Deltaproteobacteria bacterium]